MRRVGQNRIYAPYMTVYLVISLPKLPNIHSMYGSGQIYTVYMVLANPIEMPEIKAMQAGAFNSSVPHN